MFNPWKKLILPILFLLFGTLLVQQIAVFIFSQVPVRTLDSVAKSNERLLLTKESQIIFEKVKAEAISSLDSRINFFLAFDISQDNVFTATVILVHVLVAVSLLLMLKPCKFVLERWQRWVIFFVSFLTIGVLYWQLDQSSNLQPPLFNDVGYQFESEANLLKTRINILLLFLSGLFAFTIFTELNSKKWLKYSLTVLAFIILFVGQNLFLGLIYSSLSEVYTSIDPEQPKNLLKMWFLAVLILSLGLFFRQITFFIVTNKHKLVLPVSLFFVLLTYVSSTLSIHQSQERLKMAIANYDREDEIGTLLVSEYSSSEEKEERAILKSSWKKSDNSVGRLTLGEERNGCRHSGKPINCSAYDSKIGQDYLNLSGHYPGFDYFNYLYQNQGYEAAIKYGEDYFLKEFPENNGNKYPDLMKGFLGYSVNYVMVRDDPFWTQKKQDVLYHYRNSVAALTNTDLLGKFGISKSGKSIPELSTITANINFDGKPYNGEFYLSTKFSAVPVKNGKLEIRNVMKGEYEDFALVLNEQHAASYLAENWPEVIVVDGKQEIVDLGVIEIRAE